MEMNEMIPFPYVMFILLLIVYIIIKCRNPPLFPPGPLSFPLVGSLPFLARHTGFLDTVMSLSAKYGPIVGLYMGPRPMIVLGDLDIIKELFKKEELSSRAPGLFSSFRYGDMEGKNVCGLLFSSGSEWQEQRRFTLKNLRDFGFGKSGMESVLKEECLKLCNLLETYQGQPTILGKKMTTSILNALWAILVGEKLSLADTKPSILLEKIDELNTKALNKPILLMLGPSIQKYFPNWSGLNVGIDTFDSLKKFLRPYIEDHRKNFEEDDMRDFIDVYLKAGLAAKPNSSFYGERGMKNLEIGLLDLFIAGTETTTTTLLWAVLYLLHHPEVQERVQKELDDVVGHNRTPGLEDEKSLKYTRATILEVHRCASIVFAGLPHFSTTKVNISGYEIPSGSRVVANIGYVMHDPKHWNHPHTFNPNRFLDSTGNFLPNARVIPFLVGKRYCLGQSLAEKEMFIFFTMLLQRFTFTPAFGSQLPSYDIRHVRANEGGVIRYCPPYQVVINKR